MCQIETLVDQHCDRAQRFIYYVCAGKTPALLSVLLWAKGVSGVSGVCVLEGWLGG